MKRYILLFIFAASVMCGCSKDEKPVPDSGVVGEWHLTSWNGESPAENFDVYIGFHAEGYFSLWQKVETSTYLRYNGSFTADGAVLSGIYDDGTEWSTAYNYSISNNGKTLTMTANTGSATVSIYERMEIPEDVMSAAEASSVKSGEFAAERFL